ncbi:MAG TPA: hypothetical protein VF670_13655 [Duganella sp.]|jgi:hypothetical protein
MNILKNFEAVFIMTLALAFAADYALDIPVQNQIAAQEMPVVVISAKRLTDEQKKQMLIEESRTTLTADVTTSRNI